MFTMHCTKKALDRLTVKPVEILPASTTCLGNWYCNEFTVSRSKYLAFVNEPTLLPVVISLKGLNTSRGILECFKQRLFKIFLLLEIPENKFMPELLVMDEVVFVKTASRSIVGSMNDIISQAKFCAIYHDIDVDSLAMFELLSKIPLKANSYKHSTELAREHLTHN